MVQDSWRIDARGVAGPSVEASAVSSRLQQFLGADATEFFSGHAVQNRLFRSKGFILLGKLFGG